MLICVPTPLTPNREPDLEPLLGAAGLSHVVQRGQLVILESTTYPGTTRKELVPLLERRGLKVGEGLNVALSPERLPWRRRHERHFGILTLRSANNDAP